MAPVDLVPFFMYANDHQTTSSTDNINGEIIELDISVNRAYIPVCRM
ncbi:11207_t:CDS:2 [Racocetra persica]|uniref:11207_t:CDS:1 n=1 Tax=Racocetra persica TaxID=160502 RepID=A0ACA9KA78_9GLOM|nr:11207_t:CDS:2 [Racocetra persica]